LPGFTAQGSADLPGRSDGGDRGDSRGGHRWDWVGPCKLWRKPRCRG
jgi:hypothetical protein